MFIFVCLYVRCDMWCESVCMCQRSRMCLHSSVYNMSLNMYCGFYWFHAYIYVWQFTLSKIIITILREIQFLKYMYVLRTSVYIRRWPVTCKCNRSYIATLTFNFKCLCFWWVFCMYDNIRCLSFYVHAYTLYLYVSVTC